MKSLASAGCLLLLFWGHVSASAQQYTTKADNLIPITPTAFQFLKYTELPVNEYSGIPTIEVPLHTVEEDGVKVPVTLRYHAGGLRVTQEASWVGLGWDLTMGSVIQTINDADDFGVQHYPDQDIPYQKLLPDYHQSPIPSAFPMRYQYPLSLDGGGWSNPYPIYPVQALHSFKYATDYYVPVNGQFSVRQTDLFTSEQTDSEPDIFRANFLGHSLTFIRDFKYGGFTILNKKGYQLDLVEDRWKITTPNGEIYEFAEKSTVNTASSSNSAFGNSGNTALPSTVMWMLTRITTAHKKVIEFHYITMPEAYTFPSVSQKFQQATLQSQSTVAGGEGFLDLETYFSQQPNAPYIFTSSSLSSEKQPSLAEIIAPAENVVFETSPRNDVLSGRKLDKISVVSTVNKPSPGVLRKQFSFVYSYAQALMGSSANAYALPPLYQETDQRLQRLHLESVQEKGNPAYLFRYNATPLPVKNSCAVDYWGYYNGNTDNKFLVPNPAQFNLDWGDNGDNHSAREEFAKAEILEEIVYPTGGKATFDYELHEFDNSWVPDYATSTNTLAHGNGLRVRRVRLFENTGKLAKATLYQYTGGKTLLPTFRFRTYYTLSLKYDNQNPGTSPYTNRQYIVKEVNGAGYYSSTPLCSSTGVGYSKVTKTNECSACAGDGRIETYYRNTPDISPTTAGSSFSFRQLSLTLPAYKVIGQPENGSVDSTVYFTTANQRVRKVSNTYATVTSPIYYGARIFGYGNYINQTVYAQHLIGYYPLFDAETLLLASVTTDYSPQGPVTTVLSNSYDTYNQVRSTAKQRNSDYEATEYTYPYTNLSTASPTWLKELVNQNRLSEIVAAQKIQGAQALTASPVSFYSREFQQAGDLLLESSATLVKQLHPFDNRPTQILYDRYDAEGNLLQFHKADDVSTSFLWGYANQLVIAEAKNATYEQIAYTSFEPYSAGRWNYDEQSVTSGGITGRWAYNLAASVSSPRLPPGVYTLTYWAKGGQPTLSFCDAGTAGVLQSAPQSLAVSATGWTQYKAQVTLQTAGACIRLSGSAGVLLDEARLYPAGAELTAFTHDHLVGVTSRSTPDGRVALYEYDAQRRLKRVRDERGRVLAQQAYHYARP